MTLIVAVRGKPKERGVRVLLDDGAQVPVLSQHIATQLNIPRWKHKEPLSLQAWDSSAAEGGVEYGGPVVLRHREDHFTKLSLELAPLDDEVDVLLPYWWLQQHRPEGFFDGPNHVTFGSTYCKKHCTSLAVQGQDWTHYFPSSDGARGHSTALSRCCSTDPRGSATAPP
ncbi:hypothetical protein QBC35DRAFT_510439 [Podospora australis]|uniref:Uncharacterized protein n=1 Tax=Podospora australis TaxID=1536484 RepID=A0AAN7AB70_9PEZI|nr:hypothetical protein QBC35DRAFT_510439 [Podospora australis]